MIGLPSARLALSLIINAAWAVFFAYWIWAARRRNKARRREPAGERILHILWLGFGFYLLYADEPWLGRLNNAFVRDKFWVAALGALLTVAGIAFAIWARAHLGRYWSAEVTIRAEHKLIRTGPYKYVRHPIYTGLLLAILGSAVAIGKYRGLVAFAIFALGWSQKAQKEQSYLAQEFGPAFEEHKRKTGFFLPRL